MSTAFDPEHSDDDQGRWVTVFEAAQAFGVSVDTIRRRMKRGELDTRREQTPQGFRWLVRAPDPQEAAPGRTDTRPQGEPSVVMTADHEMIDTLRQELAHRNREIAHLHEIIATQANAIAQATAALPATTAPSRAEEPAAQPAPQASPLHQDAGAAGRDDTVPRESVWARVRRWVTG